MTELRFYVPGKPQTAGSKSAIPGKGPNGRPLVVESGDRKAKRAWRADVQAAAIRAMADEERLLWPAAPLDARFVFVRKRPSGHLRTGKHAGQLKDTMAGARPTQRPDADKLARAVSDALTGLLWADDSQLVSKLAEKVYADQVGLDPRAEGVLVVVRDAEPYAGPSLHPSGVPARLALVPDPQEAA